MTTQRHDAGRLATVRAALQSSSLFHGLTEVQVAEVSTHGTIREFKLGEYLTTQGKPATAFYIIAEGTAVIQRARGDDGSIVDIAQVCPPDAVGEMGVLLRSQRSASVVCQSSRLLAVEYTQNQFENMLKNLPYFALVLCRTLAARVQDVNRQVLLAKYSGDLATLDPSVCGLLPSAFQQRHRVVPLELEGTRLTVGFVDAPTDRLLGRVQQHIRGMLVRPVNLTIDQFEDVFRRHGTGSIPVDAVAGYRGPLDLDALLTRAIAEGASDLHLSASQTPRWRIDGDLVPLRGMSAVDGRQIWAQVQPLMPPARCREFEETSDADFAYALGDDSRFRVNVFRDLHGVSAVFRHIPNQIRRLEQLGLPPSVETFCDLPHGLVLVTGPTGSGKSTTLAAMIDAINRTRAEHIVTLEDPIEFVHPSLKSLVNQREVGSHTLSFSRALRSALREDPDIVLVGEMRDLETVSLAIETAQTGHLVFGTLHTSTAIGTIERIVGMYPHEEQGQARVSLAEVLKGVVAQTLLPKNGGGRVGAFEVLVMNHAVANLIRDMKSAQIMNQMETGRHQGNQLLNVELVRLVRKGAVAEDVARRHAVQKADFDNRLAKA